MIDKLLLLCACLGSVARSAPLVAGNETAPSSVVGRRGKFCCLGAPSPRSTGEREREEEEQGRPALLIRFFPDGGALLVSRFRLHLHVRPKGPDAYELRYRRLMEQPEKNETAAESPFLAMTAEEASALRRQYDPVRAIASTTTTATAASTSTTTEPCLSFENHLSLILSTEDNIDNALLRRHVLPTHDCDTDSTTPSTTPASTTPAPPPSTTPSETRALPVIVTLRTTASPPPVWRQVTVGVVRDGRPLAGSRFWLELTPAPGRSDSWRDNRIADAWRSRRPPRTQHPWIRRG